MAFVDNSFDPNFATPAQWAWMYRGFGIQIVPGHLPSPTNKNWKRPALNDWKELQETLVPEATFQRWYGPGGQYASRPNMGIVTGRCSENATVIDLDIHKKPEAGIWWADLVMEHCGGIEPKTWQQVTGGGGRQILFKWPAGRTAPTNKTNLGVDVRGQGGFAVLPPSHHESTQDYRWVDGCAPWQTPIADAPEWLVEAVDQLIVEHGGATTKSDVAGTQPTPSPEQERNAFNRLIDGRDHYMRDLIWAAVVELRRESPIPLSDAELLRRRSEVWQTYEQNVATRLVGLSNPEGLERENRGWSMFCEKWRRAVGKWETEIADEARVVQAQLQHDDNSAPNLVTEPAELIEPIELVDAFPIAEGDIPPRNWVAPGLLLKAYLSILVAPPGTGKSLLTLQVAIALALGMSWGGWFPRGPQKVLVINAEDDLNEMRRRLVAAARIMGVDPKQLEGRLFLAKAPESIVLTKTDPRTKAIITTPLKGRLVETIKRNKIDVCIADPFAETFEGDENSNSEMKWAAIAWREIARATVCAIWLVHHTRKYAQQMAGDMDASRGASALAGAARVMSTIFGMTDEEAKMMDVPPADRYKYIRFDDAKGSYALATTHAKWFEKKSVTLNNGNGLVPGDEVGALEPWTPPGLLDTVSIGTIHTIIATIDKGVLDEAGMPTGELYGAHGNSTNWAGKVIQDRAGCDKAKAKKILEMWLKDGALVEVQYKNANRKDRDGVKAGPNRPGEVLEA